MCVSSKDRNTSEELRKLIVVQPITTVIRSGRLRWYGHMMRKRNEDCVQKCIEFGRGRPVGQAKKDYCWSGECRSGNGRT